jgi:molecular chaperone IbpA
MRVGNISFSPLYPSTLGFESILNDMEKILGDAESRPTQSTFPPHNIIALDKNNYLIEIAIAGFSESEIEINICNGDLTIKGDKKTVNDIRYIHHGIANRSFIKKIRLADTIEVKEAHFNNGILSINLENIIPDNKKSRVIQINVPKERKQLLTE